MDSEHTSGQMADVIQDSTSEIENTVMAHILGPMEENTKVSGKMEDNMAKESTHQE